MPDMFEELLKQLGVGQPAPVTGSLANGEDVSKFLHLPMMSSSQPDVYLDAPVTIPEFSKVGYATSLYVIPMMGNYPMSPIDSALFDDV